MADAYARSQSLLMLSRTGLRRIVRRSRVLSWLASRRRPLMNALRRRGLMR